MDVRRPRTLSGTEAKQRRLGLVHSANPAEQLNSWVSATTKQTGLSIPRFDPLDAGIDARVLFLLESPGPKADATEGSGFISADNNDPTAENMWTFRHNAGIGPDTGLHWNIVPWYLDGGKPGSAHIERGARMLAELLALLPRLEVVVPMGRDAQKGWLICQHNLRRHIATVPHRATVPTWHPSNLGLAKPGRREAVQRALLGVRGYLDTAP